MTATTTTPAPAPASAGTTTNPADSSTHDTGVCEERTLEYQLSEHQIRGWGAVFAAGLQGKGLRKRSSVCVYIYIYIYIKMSLSLYIYI